MEQIQHLLAGLDWVAIGSAAVSFIIGLSFMKGFLSKAHTLIHDLSELLEEIDTDMDDGKLSKEEIVKIVDKCKSLIAAFKA